MPEQVTDRLGLHVEQTGHGKPVVMLHGWGMHGALFQSIADKLQHEFHFYLVDLPGHGLSKVFDEFADINKLSDYLFRKLKDIVAQPFVLVGWSMGGLLAQKIAIQHSDYVKKLVLLSATPCFCQRSDWKYAVEKKVLQEFSGGLIAEFRNTLERFLAIQFFGTDNQKEHLRNARKMLLSRPSPQPLILEQGLRLLDETDLRTELSNIKCKTLLISGERDALVPPRASSYLAENIPDARVVILKGAGHAPFLSHEEKFLTWFRRFLHE